MRPAGCRLQFNLSHTTGLVVCAVGLDGAIGVDVEDLTRRAADPALAVNYFAPEEVAWLEAGSQEQRQVRFLELWTLKEAFIKAKGKGLSIPLKDFAFSFPAGRPPRVDFRDPDLGHADRWQFARLRLHERYQLAVAMHLPGGENAGFGSAKRFRCGTSAATGRSICAAIWSESGGIGGIRDLGAQLSMNSLRAHFELGADLDLLFVAEHGQRHLVPSLAALEGR